MDRLTQRVKSLGDIWLLENGKTKEMVTESNEYKEYFEKLAEYEELEENGLILRLPAKVGGRVYAFCGEFGILHYDVDCIVMFENDITFQCTAWADDGSECLDEIEISISDFGKTVFLTYEEAKENCRKRVKQWED